MTTIKIGFGEGGQNLVPVAGGDPTVAETFRDVADDFTVLRTQFIALLTKLDSELGLEEIVELANDIKAKYDAHRILTGTVHENADSTNDVTAADATDLATANTLVNDIKAQLNAHNAEDSELEEAFTLLNEIKVDFDAHRVLVGGSEHGTADSTNDVTAADATDLATANTLANDIKVQLNAHNAEASELEEAIVLLNDIKAIYEAHRVFDTGGQHNANPDTTNVVTAADATDLASANTLANDIKVQYEAHRQETPDHTNADSTNTITAANATTFATLKTLTTELRLDYEAHRVLTAGPTHGAADATNVITAVDVGTAGIHLVDDVTNVVTSANATTFATLKTLSNELRTDYEAHRVDTDSHGAADATNTVSAVAVGAAGIHQIDDTTNVVTSPDATTRATLSTLVNEIRADYEAHRVDTTSHEAADATNVLSEPEASTNYVDALTPDAMVTIKG